MERQATFRPTLAHGRKIAAILYRNAHEDSNHGKIDYKGFHFAWDDGTPAQLAFNRFCTIGVRTIFGRHLPPDDTFQVQFFLIPLDDPYAPRPSVPRHVKPRRIYFQRHGSMAVMHLPDGTSTDIAFAEDDDPRLVEWVGLQELAEGQRQWYDVVAICNGNGSAGLEYDSPAAQRRGIAETDSRQRPRPR